MSISYKKNPLQTLQIDLLIFYNAISDAIDVNRNLAIYGKGSVDSCSAASFTALIDFSKKEKERMTSNTCLRNFNRRVLSK